MDIRSNRASWEGDNVRVLQQFILVWAAWLAFLTPCLAQADIALPPGGSVAGISQAEWSKRWWQWAGSFDDEDSPVADRTGKYCHLKQSGPVWFLAGTYGTQRTVRTCRVPRDKYLFFPLINFVAMPEEGSRAICASYVEAARSITDRPFNLLLDLDGRRMQDLATYRQMTKECFDMGALAEPKERIFPSAANGYYVMLRPLSPGKHLLNFGGSLPGPGMSQAITYTLIVE
jgi:hypothetical protein